VTASNTKQMELTELENDLIHREAEIELLQETFADIGSELNLERVFEIVAERAQKLIQAETLLIPLLDESCSTYTYRGGAGKNATEIVGESLPLDFGVCGWVWRHKKPWWRGMLDDLSPEERNLWEKEAGTMILTPLQGRKHFLGGIAGINKIGGGDFDRRDLNMLSLFSSIVAIAIENAMAVDKIEAAKKLNNDYHIKLQRLNKQLTESSKQLEQLSLYDPLTSLPNRSLFKDRLTQHISIARANSQKVSLLLIDLNDFKHINETLGHDKGDHLLNLIAQCFQENLESNETLSRLGGDEFVLISPEMDSKQAMKRATEILKLLTTPFKLDDTHIAINASIGIAVYPENGKDTSTLLRRADQAMYNAKENKRGITIYNPSDDHSSLGQLTMVADLRRALDEDQFELHYQPKLTLIDNKLVGVEALGRWTHPVRGFIPPNIFITALEQTGLIDNYTVWVIEQALIQIDKWNHLGHKIKVAVNISTQTLMNPDFINDIKPIVSKQKNSGQLIFEITENLFLSNHDHLSATLSQIRSMDIELSIDDFGTGYSSLSRLKKLPVSELKIDQSFVTDMDKDPDNKVIILSTIDLAHNLGLSVVAEGIETEDIYKQLKTMGCDIAQGYLISKPMPVKQFDVFLKNEFSDDLIYKNIK